MKTLNRLVLGALLFLLALNPQLSSAFAQGTAFTYQGQLQNNGSPASGTYNLTFTLFTNTVGGTAVAGPVTNNTVVVTNGLFTTLVGFGPNVFTGASNWLEIGVETNGAGSFATLTPRQQLTPAPYAIYAESVTASGISGTLLDTQLLHDAVTVTAGPGFSGGGKVSLGNTITLTNTGVLSVTGSADITAATVGGAVTLGDTATSADTASTLVKRDGSGNFSAATITLDGNLTLPAITAVSPDMIYSGTNLLLYGDNNGNLFAGLNAGNSATSGSDNTANGVDALVQNTSGTGNTADGYNALNANTNGSYNTAIGFQALFSNQGGAVSYYGSYNTAIGFQALYHNTSSYENLASGAYALWSNTSGSGNTAEGVWALFSNTNGTYNTANGSGALYSNTSGTGNTADGDSALDANTSGSYNTAAGLDVLYVMTNGNNNTAIGVSALQGLRSGDNNIALGYTAGQSVLAGTNNIEIGDAGNSSDNDTIRIGTQGTQTNTFIAGISGATAASGVAVYVNASGKLGTLTSSRRFKDDIQGMDQASDVLYALKPVTFKYKPDIDPQGIPQFGLVAEDVEKVAPDLVAHDGQGKIYTVRYQAVDAMLLNEFLKEHRTVEEQNAAIQGLNQKVESGKRKAETQMEKLEAENAELKQKNNSLERRLEALEQIILKQKQN